MNFITPQAQNSLTFITPPARRGHILESYHDEIEAVYSAVDSISQSDIALPTSWDLDNITKLVREIVQNILCNFIEDESNIFNAGGDSLAATAIRNSIIRAVREGRVLPIASMRIMPQNFVYEFPSIQGLSAFVYGFILGTSNIPALRDLEEEEDYYPMYIPLPMSGHTVVKLREGKGETPLIMIHGAGGLFFEYASYSEKFQTAVWTLQVTPDTPVTTLDEMASFYFTKIKDQQPKGPYRLAAYSSTSILGFVLAKLFEDNGDVVIQLAMLDHFPLLFVYTANQAGNVNPRDPKNRKQLAEWSIEAIRGLMMRDANWTLMETAFQTFLDAHNGLPAPEPVKFAASTAVKYLTLVADFVYDLVGGCSDFSESLQTMLQWMSLVSAPVTVYVAQTGVLGIVEEKDKAEWADLGTKHLAGARAMQLGGGHYEFLMNEVVIRDLQGIIQ